MSSSSEHKDTKMTCDWGSAIDPKSEREYYYNTKTKETTWTKPIELATPDEQKNMLIKKQEMKLFFAEMEANIRRKFLVDTYYDTDDDEDQFEFGKSPSDNFRGFQSDYFSNPTGRARSKSKSQLGGIRLIRTISSVDGKC